MSGFAPGFAPTSRTSNYLDLIGPIGQAGVGKDLRLGLRVEDKHINAKGTVHGAIFTALADVGLGYALASSEVPPLRMVTTSLTTDFIGSARLGQWLETRLEGARIGKVTVFGWGVIVADDVPVARMNALFQRMEGQA
jgi:acyl-coenzyme A thioesterase 13